MRREPTPTRRTPGRRAEVGPPARLAFLSARADPDAWYGRDARVFEIVRTAATADIRINDKVEAGQALYTVRDMEAGRWGIKLTAERTT